MITCGGTPSLRTLGLISSVALLIIANGPVRAQTAEEQEKRLSPRGDGAGASDEGALRPLWLALR